MDITMKCTISVAQSLYNSLEDGLSFSRILIRWNIVGKYYLIFSLLIYILIIFNDILGVLQCKNSDDSPIP